MNWVQRRFKPGSLFFLHIISLIYASVSALHIACARSLCHVAMYCRRLNFTCLSGHSKALGKEKRFRCFPALSGRFDNLFCRPQLSRHIGVHSACVKTFIRGWQTHMEFRRLRGSRHAAAEHSVLRNFRSLQSFCGRSRTKIYIFHLFQSSSIIWSLSRKWIVSEHAHHSCCCLFRSNAKSLFIYFFLLGVRRLRQKVLCRLHGGTDWQRHQQKY